MWSSTVRIERHFFTTGEGNSLIGWLSYNIYIWFSGIEDYYHHIIIPGYLADVGTPNPDFTQYLSYDNDKFRFQYNNGTVKLMFHSNESTTNQIQEHTSDTHGNEMFKYFLGT